MIRMPSLRIARFVATKEILDIIRDWRTLVAMLVVPLLILPLIFIALPMFLAGEIAELDSAELNLTIEVEESESVPESILLDLENSNTSITIEQLIVDGELAYPGEEGESLKQDIDDGRTHALLRIRNVSTNETILWEYAILYDSTDELSREARERAYDAIEKWEDSVIEQNLANAGLTVEEAVDPISFDGDFESSDMSTEGEAAGFALSLLIPVMVAMWVASSAMQPSIDMTAGERERGTMEALLCTSASRIELLFGKWIAVVVVGVTSVAITIAVFLFAIAFMLPSGFFGIPSLGVSSIIALILAILLYTISVIALELAIAVRSHSVKEAGTTLAPLMLAFIAPALFAQFVNLEGIELLWFAAPVLNVCLAMREALLDTTDWTHILVWSVSSLVYAILAVAWASKQFNREDLVDSIS